MFFVLFACCVPVKGARRSIVCDLQRQAYRFIPNGLYEILTLHAAKNISEIKEIYGPLCESEIDEYFAFLEANDFGFWSNEPTRFPKMSSEWETPERITNAIIDVDPESYHNYVSLFSELDDLGCKAVEVRFFYDAGESHLRSMLEASKYGRLRSVDLLVGYSESLTSDLLKSLCRDYRRVSRIIVHSAPHDSCLEVALDGTDTAIILSMEVIDSPGCCGQVHPAYFAVNLGSFTEARKFNSCLNKKIAIDARGEIRNCPSLSKSFGNVRKDSLHSALAHRDFQSLWSISKDNIDVCKDCEFRYICTDCRAYIEKDSDHYSKPAKCKYDPYTAKWKWE